MPEQLDTSPLNATQRGQVAALVATLSPAQRRWLVDYLTELGDEPMPGPRPAPGTGPVGIVYATETGHAERVATQLYEVLASTGVPARLASCDRVDPRRLPEFGWLFLVASTHGDGDPPEPAAEFVRLLAGRRAPRLDGLRYAVFGLGDRTYPRFCETAKALDARLSDLGAIRLLPLVTADVDFEPDAQAWIEAVRGRLAEHHVEVQPVLVPDMPPPPAPAQVDAATRTNPVETEILDAVVLNGRGSDKDTWHVECAWDDAWARFEPGDALGVVPENDPALVDAVIAAFGWDPATPYAGRPLGEVLRTTYEIAHLAPSTVEAVSDRASRRPLGLSEPNGRAVLAAYCAGRDLADLAVDFGLRGLPPEAVLPSVRRLEPRLYSIASSLRWVPGEVHLTVGRVHYFSNGRERSGVASGWIRDAARTNKPLRVFVQRNPRFRLPPDPAAPLILIGPGTGVAPFRAFVQDRAAVGATGPIWLFFGDRHFRTDFLYQKEWLRWREDGIVTRLAVAFSRDGPDKVYVQHRLAEHAADLVTWLDAGAYVYVCGDAARMAPDVDQALRDVVARVRGWGADRAARYWEELREAGRYRRDVY